MNHEQMPAWLTRTLLAGLGVIFVLMPVHAFVSTWGGSAIGPLWLWKSWKELLLVGLTLMTLVWLFAKPMVLRSLLKQPLALTLVLYMTLTFALALLHRADNGAAALAAGLAMNLRYIAVATLAYLVFRYSTTTNIWLRRACWFVVITGVVVSVIGIAQVLWLPSDFLTQFGYGTTTIAPAAMIDNNPHLLRAFATLRGPNDFGAFLILPMVLVLARFRQFPRWFSLGALFVMSWALTLSGSRSAWIGAFVAIAAYVLLRLGRAVSARAVWMTSGIVAIMVLASLYAAVSVPQLRMAIFHSSPGDPSLTEGSTDNHFSATAGGVKRVVANPLGCGPGCAGPASYYSPTPKISENYFVQIAEETGVAGLGLFLILLGIVARRLYVQPTDRRLSQVLLASFIGYLAIGLLLHVWSDDPLSITWWMLAGALIGYNENQQWIKSKHSSPSKT